ncbi:unnamed protein product, partial [marine sediment metagenome]
MQELDPNVKTPGLKTVQEVSDYLKAPPEKFIKTLLFNGGPGFGIVAAFIRGDHELNESALKKAIEKTTNSYGVSLEFLSDEEIVELGSAPGFSGPIGLTNRPIVIHEYFDEAVFHVRNAISGANKKDLHMKNINIERDVATRDNLYTGDFRKVIKGDNCPHCSKPLIFKRGIEVGHTFYLGTKYSEKMSASFCDEDGQHRAFVMGCYGIGVSRIAAAAIEQSHDKDGIIWPKSIAPFDIMLIQLSGET